jgi:hypothetical protein
MIKMTIVTDVNGKLIGAVSGHTLVSKHGEIEAGVTFPDGHKLHKVEVEEDMGKITDPAVFHERLLKHIPKA